MKRKQTNIPDSQIMADHIKELRVRLFACIIILVAGGVVGYLYYEEILWWLRSPLNADLYYTTPAGSFMFIMKVATMVGVGVMVPVIVYNLLMFIQPAIKNRFSMSKILGMTVVSVLLAATGAAFAFYTIIPGALHFFQGFQVTGLSALISADSYLSLVTNALIVFMIVFQMPLVMVILDRIKPLSPKKLFSYEKYVILGSLVASLLVPFAMDFMTSLLIASPIVLLYNISIGMIFLSHVFTRKVAMTESLYRSELQVNDSLISEFFSQTSEPLDDEPAFDWDRLKSPQPVATKPAIQQKRVVGMDMVQTPRVRPHGVTPPRRQMAPTITTIQRLDQPQRPVNRPLRPISDFR